MAVQCGKAYLDLDGNRVDWKSSPTNYTSICLEGSHFHDVLPMATLVVSALCGAGFFAILVSLCWLRVPRRPTLQTYLPVKTYQMALLSMICFFSVDIANRVYHEERRVFGVTYLAIDIVRGWFAAIADGLLMIYFLNHSPIWARPGQRKRGDATHVGLAGTMAMIIAIVFFWILAWASKGSSIWSLIVQNSRMGSGNGLFSDSHPKEEKYVKLSVNIYQDLNSAACGMLLLFSIGFALFSTTFIRRCSTERLGYKHLKWSAGVLAASYVARNAVIFIFDLLYAQFNHTAALSIQLVYMVCYGGLSMVLYSFIVVVATAVEKEGPLQDNPTYGPVQQTGTDDGPSWQQQKPQVHVVQDHYPSPYGSYPYYQQNASHQQWQ